MRQCSFHPFDYRRTIPTPPHNAWKLWLSSVRVNQSSRSLSPQPAIRSEILGDGKSLLRKHGQFFWHRTTGKLMRNDSRHDAEPIINRRCPFRKKTLTCPGYDHPIQALLVTQSPPDHNSLLTQGLACSYSPIPIYLEGDSTRKHSLFTRWGSLVRGPLFFLRRRSSLKLKYDDINVLGEHPRNMTFFPYLTRLLFLLATLLK